MRLTERQARIRLAAAVAAAGSQIAFARSLNLASGNRGQTLVSRSMLGRNRISDPILAAIGLRRDAAGDIHTIEPNRNTAA